MWQNEPFGPWTQSYLWRNALSFLFFFKAEYPPSTRRRDEKNTFFNWERREPVVFSLFSHQKRFSPDLRAQNSYFLLPILVHTKKKKTAHWNSFFRKKKKERLKTNIVYSPSNCSIILSSSGSSPSKRSCKRSCLEGLLCTFSSSCIISNVTFGAKRQSLSWFEWI